MILKIKEPTCQISKDADSILDAQIWNDRQLSINKQTAKDIITNLRLTLIEKANQILPNIPTGTLIFWVIHYVNNNHYSFIIQYLSPDDVHHFIHKVQTEFIYCITQTPIYPYCPLLCEPIKYYYCLTKVTFLVFANNKYLNTYTDSTMPSHIP